MLKPLTAQDIDRMIGESDMTQISAVAERYNIPLETLVELGKINFLIFMENVVRGGDSFIEFCDVVGKVFLLGYEAGKQHDKRERMDGNGYHQ